MYLEFFGFGKAPFGGPVEPNELFLAETHREALATFVYGIVSRKPIIMVTGDVGVGKTTVLRTALTHLLEEPLVIIEVPHPLLRPDEVVREIAQALKMERAQELTIAKLERVHDAIKEVCATGKRIIFIVDEAQEMPHETLEFIRLMSNMEVGVTGRFQIILVGQTELERTLAKPHFRHLRQRIALRGTLKPLSRVDAADYLRHRLELAGGQAEAILTPGAVKKIVSASGGIPRRINAITDNALLLAFGEGRKPVPASIVSEAAAGLDRGMRFGTLRRYAQPAAVGVGALLLVMGAGSMLTRPSEEKSPAPAPTAGVEPQPAAAANPASASQPTLGNAPESTIGGAPPAAGGPASNPEPAPRGDFYQEPRPALALSNDLPAPRTESAPAATSSPTPSSTVVARTEEPSAIAPSPAARVPSNVSSVPVGPAVVAPPTTTVASAAPAVEERSSSRSERNRTGRERAERERRSSDSGSTVSSSTVPASAASDRAPAEGSPSWLPYAHRLEPGETVRDVLMRAYGSYNQDALFLFHALNSEVANPENAGTGDVIWVPVRKDRESGFFLSDSRP